MTAVPADLPIRVLLADPHALFRRGVRLVLEEEPDIEVVGEAGEGLDAVERVVELIPDLVLMDVRMPGVSGIEATRRVRELVPSVKVAILTVSESDDDLFAAVRAGATGYLLKDADADEVAVAVRAAHNGEVHLDQAVTRLLAQRLRQKKAQPEPVEPLTERELEVLGLLGRGSSNKEIASALLITERTARTHVSNILGKLGLSSRTQAALYAVERGLVART